LFVTLTIAPAFVLESKASSNNELFFAYAVLISSIGLVVVFLFVINYELDEEKITVKIGPIKLREIKLNEIEKIERSYNPLSSPASSLKRLYLKTVDEEILISPTNEKEFIRLLKTRNPKIDIQISEDETWWKIWNWDV
jgi:hypothetical protein